MGGLAAHKGSALAAFALALAVSGSAAAGHGARSFVDSAKVVDVEPIVRTVRVDSPRRECWDEEVQQRGASHAASAGSMIVGGAIGGLVGHQLGRRVDKGRGRHAAALVGTLIGAAVGHDSAAHGGEPRVSYRERCRVYHDYQSEERIEGYRVTYRYKGEEFQTVMDEHPGKRIQVRVQVAPIAR